MENENNLISEGVLFGIFKLKLREFKLRYFYVIGGGG